MAKEQAKPLLKTGSVSKVLGVSTVTIRKYTTEFQEYLSPSTRNETSRHFTPEDVQVLKTARQLLKEGYNYEDARQLLPERLPVEGEVMEGAEGGFRVEDTFHQEEPPGAPSAGAIAPLEFFQSFVDALKEEHRTTNQAKDEHIETLKAENLRLQAEIEYLRLPFFVKWFRKPRAE